ncbi:hypothetical protein CDD83_6988 [Cordyceps sp. RAO-2017]|nr:hypothetical protein CDD83_6988 [Cordyceps sp. RAO-2017]
MDSDYEEDPDFRRVPQTALDLRNTFSHVDEYVWRFKEGTLIEMANERTAILRMNQRPIFYEAWPIAPIPGMTNSFTKSYLVLVKIPPGESGDTFPTSTDRFSISMVTKVHRPDGTYPLLDLQASRIQNPYEKMDDVQRQDVKRCAAFKVEVARAWVNDDGATVEIDLMAQFNTATFIGDGANIRLDEAQKQMITIRWEFSSATYDAELAALRRMTQRHRLPEMNPTPKSYTAFHTILDFQKAPWVEVVDLHAHFPQIRNPARRDYGISDVLLDKLDAFNEDHQAALDGLRHIPNGLYLVNGCPGAGKTEWNMVLAALVQSRKSPLSKREHSPILFLVDINKTVDDAANRYYRLCKALGLKLLIIRMHGWPYEMRNSSRLNSNAAGRGQSQAELDFTKRFLTTVGISRNVAADRAADVAPTLDEAAWEFYEAHKSVSFRGLKIHLARLDAGVPLDSEDWKALRNQVTALYRAVLAKADFVATTPVAAYGSFPQLFAPDLIFMDEAPHCRELSSLIAIAFFTPLAWIFTGDVKQTRPFVKCGDRQQSEREGLLFNPFGAQLQTSMMARAAAVGAINTQLLVNNRSFGNLHRLASRLFYDYDMISGYEREARYPASTLHLKRYLEGLGTAVANIRENRVVVDLSGSREESSRESFWNPAHHEWIVRQVRDLLDDENFRSIPDSAGNSHGGTVMISTPYSGAVRHYHVAVKTWPAELQSRVEVLTVDKAQGNQADIVFLDMVRTIRPGFMEDALRLNVAITRARQAEVIVMNHGMTMRGRGRAHFLSAIWDDASRDRRLHKL